MMKQETIIKVLNRYCKGLEAMMNEAIDKHDNVAIKHYEFDITVFEQAINIIKGKE